MESTAPTTTPATSTDACLTVTPASLAAAFASVPDPRREASVTYPLPAVLTLAVAALLCAHTSVLAMAEWGAQQSAEILQRLGFPEGRAPCQSTLHRLFRKLDGGALAAALRAYFGGTVLPTGRGSQGVAIDGKAQRGRCQYDPAAPPVHHLAAFCHEQGVVLASQPIAAGTDKQEAELTVAPVLLDAVDWHGRVLTGDALFCQRHLCQQLLDAGGDYLLLVKANQPRLAWAIELLFDPPHQTPPLIDQREARSLDQGHGRTAEVRHLVASTDLTAYLDWPGLAQVFRVERTWWEQGKQKRQVRHGITSLPPEIGTAQRLLALKRGHWSIENRLHRGKDVNLGEDASLIHQGQGPVVCTVLRDAALSLLYQVGCSRIASRLRYHSRHPAEALALLLWPASTRA
jgi:predicted transposase YbfD/YdcC